MPAPPQDRNGFEIGIICALTLEASAAHVAFDKFWDEEGQEYGKAPGDENSYTTGTIGSHNVVLAHMEGVGKVKAASVAVGLRSSFPNIKIAIILGMCGGVPHSTEGEIFLGDMLISTGIVQYDLGKQYPVSFELIDTLRRDLGGASQRVERVLAKARTDHYRNQISQDIERYMADFTLKSSKAQRPVSDDILLPSGHLHQHRQHSVHGIDDCCSKSVEHICVSAMESSCQDLGCMKKSALVERRREATGAQPRLYFGKIGSADTVMKSGVHREVLTKESGLIGFEMEGSGVAENLPSIVMKAVCDYCDSHKNNEWQLYAATVAAAGMKAFLKLVDASDLVLNSNSSTPRAHVQRPIPTSVTFEGFSIAGRNINRVNTVHGNATFS